MMVSFDLMFRSMLIGNIFEYEGALCTEGSISWLSINRGSYQGKGLQVVHGVFCSCVSVSVVFSGVEYCQVGSQSVSSVWFPFCVL